MPKIPVRAALLCLPLAFVPGLCSAAEMTQPPAPAAPPALSVADDTCGMRAAIRFRGKQDSPALRTDLATAVGHRRIRWIRPGVRITDDMQPDRLNVIFNDKNRLATVRCG